MNFNKGGADPDTQEMMLLRREFEEYVKISEDYIRELESELSLNIIYNEQLSTKISVLEKNYSSLLS